MEKMTKKRQSFFNVGLILTVGILLLLLVSIGLGWIILVVLTNNNILKPDAGMNLFSGAIIISLVSLVLGTVFTTLYTSRIFDPFRKLTYAMHELSEGNFDTRIDFRFPFLSRDSRELSESFNYMAAQLGSVELLRSDFISDFSHEFKTPIASLKGFARILKNPDLSEKERNEYLDIIIAEADRLSVLSQNVLMLNKLNNQDKLENVEEFDLDEQIRSAIILLQNDWSEKNIQLDIELDDCRFVGNAELLNLCWINLINNAIKFSHENGVISISLTDNPDSVKFVVKDNGIGMSETDQAKIFDKFFQADSSHSTKGNGIGLTLVAKIVELHQGLITVESKLNMGSTFTVSLPKKL